MSKIFSDAGKKIHKALEARVAKKRVSISDDVLKLKSSISSADEFGSKNPFLISAIIPTFMKDVGESIGYRFEVLRDELVDLGSLIGKGIVDEIIIIDGSKTRYGTIDDKLMRQIVSAANHSIPLFHDQVDLIRKHRIIKNRVQSGFYDLAVKVVHQLDPQINDVVKRLEIPHQGLVDGKGAALWLATGMASGSLIGYLDSDIRNFRRWQAAALIKPILETWNSSNSSIEYSKAFYTRLKVNLDYPERGFYTLGGRVTRLFVIPLFRALSKQGILTGLDKLKYPLSGEFAASKKFVESLEFPVNYAFEIGALIQIWRKGLLDRISQVDLHFFQHFPQSDKSVREMVKQIIELLTYELRDIIDLKEEIVDAYANEAMKEIKNSHDIYEKAEIRLATEQEVKRDFFKDIDGDKRRVAAYAECFKNAIGDSEKGKEIGYEALPSWNQIERSQEGLKFRAFIKRRGITSTLEILKKQGLISLK